jgi:radical SAM superfamily enzyme YgiQ (UPF0313 family)
MKLKFVSVEEGISAIGFRKIISVAKKLNPDLEIYFVTTGNLYSLRKHIFPTTSEHFDAKDFSNIAKEIADADLLCFSAMTPSAPYVERLIKLVRKINPKIYVLWGGAHSIIYPDEAIEHADAICTGEGEIPFVKFYKAFCEGGNYLKTPTMWFKKGKRTYRNLNLPLNTPKQIDSFPYLYNGFDCNIYDLKLKRFRPLTQSDCLNFNGLSYKTIWTLGCPFSCIYCANDAFIKYDQKYRIVRYPSIDHILSEIESAIKINPFISTIIFEDDNFITIPTSVIRNFAKEYKKRIGLPFVVPGIHPNFITKEKIDILGKAGMNRSRMGIQSASKKMLLFYRRPTPLPIVKKSANTLVNTSRKYNMIPPAFDIIIDNPIETKEDLVETLRFLYDLERPYTLTVFSLRVFPKTKLWDYFQSHPVADIRQLTSSYLDTRKTMASILLYLLPVVKLPRFIHDYLLTKVEGYKNNTRYYPRLYWIAKTLYLISRAKDHLRRLDFSTIVGPWGYILWKVGIIKKSKVALSVIS